MTSGELHAILVPFGVTFYSIIFLLSVLGNFIVLSVCYRSIKRKVGSLKWFIANLAVADLTFVFLSILDLVSYLSRTWVGGQISCKLQSFFIEACEATTCSNNGICCLLVALHLCSRAHLHSSRR